jgi:hypothetical protein
VLTASIIRAIHRSTATRLHSSTSQKALIFKSLLIATSELCLDKKTVFSGYQFAIYDSAMKSDRYFQNFSNQVREKAEEFEYYSVA